MQRVFAVLATPGDHIPIEDSNFLRVFSNHIDAIDSADSRVSFQCISLQKEVVDRVKRADIADVSRVRASIAEVGRSHASTIATPAARATVLAICVAVATTTNVV